MKRMRSILGILLILISISGLFLWEWKGREVILMQEVLVAKEEIQKGTLVNSSMFQTKGIPKDNMLQDALTPDESNMIKGKIAMQLIPQNNQIIMKYFEENPLKLMKEESIFVIDPGWIAMRSSSLRRGDMVDVYGSNGTGFLGTFQVAFVKDQSEREVKDAAEGILQHGVKEDILNRTDSTSVIDHIEIITTFSEYEKIADCVGGLTPSALIIVQRGDSVDS
ncbi:MAG: SAF domain-containing protein [Eubacteriales bacterium]|nr:SAF domain-containing protein [Eubacteriales bacterium]